MCARNTSTLACIGLQPPVDCTPARDDDDLQIEKRFRVAIKPPLRFASQLSPQLLTCVYLLITTSILTYNGKSGEGYQIYRVIEGLENTWTWPSERCAIQTVPTITLLLYRRCICMKTADSPDLRDLFIAQSAWCTYADAYLVRMSRVASLRVNPTLLRSRLFSFALESR